MKGLSLKLGVAVPNLVLAVLLSAVYAENDQTIGGKNSQGQIDITADRHIAKSGRDSKERVFDGNVTINQDDVRLTCDRLVIVYDETKGSKSVESQGKQLPASTIKSITAAGNVKITQNERRATAGKALWDYAKRTITLTEGPPRFWQGRDSGMANKVIMYLDENRWELPEPQHGPVQEKKKEKDK
jgi:lipopolysaccharide transport protein LptA